MSNSLDVSSCAVSSSESRRKRSGSLSTRFISSASNTHKESISHVLLYTPKGREALGRFIQFTLRLIAWRRRQHTSPSAPVTQPSSLRILIAAVSLLSLARKVHRAIPSLPLSYHASLSSVQTITDDIYFLTYIWPWTSLRLLAIRARAALYADLCDLALSSHGLYGGWKTLQRVQEDIQVLREEYQLADDAELEDGLMGDIKHLRALRSKTKWRMLRSGCELVFASYDVLKIQRGEEGVRAVTGWIASAINLKLAL